ncbi:MAG: 50S ribosomal protein L25 [Candidatus Spechtbacterales bacterium]
MLSLVIQKRNPREIKAKALLNQEKIPGVLYGPTVTATPVTVDRKTFEKLYEEAGESTLVSLKFRGEEEEGGKDENVVLIRSTDVHPVTRAFRHVDFYQLPLDKPIEISVPIETENEAPAVHEQGGILVQNIHEVDIRALPKDLIHEITVDLSGLANIEDAIEVKDLVVPAGVEIMQEEDAVVFRVEKPREEEEEEPVEAEPDTDQIAEIKTEAEEKREEEEAEEQAAE